MGRQAFTLIELLITVAIIAILAAIAVPNFLEAQTRAKVSRVKADLRTVASAMEMYAVDRSSYPGDAVGPDYRGLKALTTPIAYVTNIFVDPFHKGYKDGYADASLPPDPERTPLFFYEVGTGRLGDPNARFPATVYAMAAYGPDIDDDTRTIGSFPFTQRACPYDPTNGTVSNGDIYRFGNQPNHPNYMSDANPLTF